MTMNKYLPSKLFSGNSDRILRWPEVQHRVGYCRSHIHNLISVDKFPAPIKLGARASGWLESEITEWIESRITESRNSEFGDLQEVS